MIKTVIFDIDDTLYSYKKAHAAAFAALKAYAERELSVAPEEFEALHKELNREITDRLGSCAAIHNRLIRYQNMLERLGRPICEAMGLYEVYWETLLENAEPEPGAEETMKRLKELGIRIGIGTDMTAWIQHRKLKKLGLLNYVDFMVSSEEAGAEKPSKEMFSLCLSKAKAQKEECLFVGDSRKKDAEGACTFGMKGVWYCPEGTEEEAAFPVIGNLSQILTLL